MSNRNVTDWRPYKADGAIDAYEIVHITAAGDAKGSSSAGSDNAARALPNFGVHGSQEAVDGEDVEVAVAGIAPVKYHAAVNAGDLLTSAEDGTALPTTTAGARIIGIAMEKGVAGDIGSVLLAQGSV